MMPTTRPLDPSLLKQTPPVKSYLDTYLAHNTPEMQKESPALGSFSNFPLSMLTSTLICEKDEVFLSCFKVADILCLCPCAPAGLNSNLNVSLDMSSGGGALGYKEPPHSKLKKLWATTDPLEQNSKSGRRATKKKVLFSPIMSTSVSVSF